MITKTLRPLNLKSPADLFEIEGFQWNVVLSALSKVTRKQRSLCAYV